MQKERLIRDEEYRLIKYLLKDNIEYKDSDINSLKVIGMSDGGMGSVRFIYDSEIKKNKKMYTCIAKKQFEDIDGTPISVSINVDSEGNLFELDIWRVDFNPVEKYPEPNNNSVS